MATVGFGDFEWDEDKARSNFEKHGVSFESSAARRFESSAPDEPLASKERPMSNDETTQVEPSEASLAEMPEVDFSRAIRPNKQRGRSPHCPHAGRGSGD
jgi:hypothetical protein